VTLPRPGLHALFNALVTEQMTASQDHFILVLVASVALHLWKPVMELKIDSLLIVVLVESHGTLCTEHTPVSFLSSKLLQMLDLLA
jgi:hypothetical protein